MDFKLKRKHYILGGIVLLLLFTNPSRSAFASYLHKTNNRTIGRDFNGLLFSIYSKDNIGDKKVYLGILGNFMKISYAD
jgi:hypothetical protein